MSRFYQQHDTWQYSKDEALTTNATATDPAAFQGFQWLITANPGFHQQRFMVRSSTCGV